MQSSACWAAFAGLVRLPFLSSALFAGALRHVRSVRAGASLALAILAIAVVACSNGSPLDASRIEVTASRVLQTTRKTTTRLVILRTEKGTVVTTPEHPFAKVGSGWSRATDLEAGDRIHIRASAEGTKLLKKSIRDVPSTTVYNLTVDRTHAYFVGSQELLVHNVRCFNWPRRNSERPGRGRSPEGSPRRDGPLALGLSPRERRLSQFAGQVGAKTYWDIFPIGPALPPHMIATRLTHLLESAQSLHFDLTGMIGGGRTLEQALESGAQGLREGNWTNWELYQVLSNPNYLRKATFYLNGTVYTLPPELIASVQGRRE